MRQTFEQTRLIGNPPNMNENVEIAATLVSRSVFIRRPTRSYKQKRTTRI